LLQGAKIFFGRAFPEARFAIAEPVDFVFDRAIPAPNRLAAFSRRHSTRIGGRTRRLHLENAVSGGDLGLTGASVRRLSVAFLSTSLLLL
jgi:hypothetical protein